MKAVTTGAITALSLVSVVALAACGSDNNTKKNTAASATTGAGACAAGTLNGAGSTFQANIEQQWAKDFGAQCSGAQINYQGTGSGAGIQNFGSGTIDFAGSDVLMKPAEQTKADARCAGSKAIHIPITAGGIAITYNLSGVKDLNLSATTLAGIFQGTIKKWDDPAIKADNSGVSLPSTAIAPVHRSDGSGTTSVFSAFEDANAKGVWKLGVNKSLTWPGGQAAKGSDGVTGTVKQTQGGITYVEVSFAQANGLPIAKVKGGGGFVALTADNVGKAISAITFSGTGNDLAGKINYTSTAGYPVSTVSYVIVCEKTKDAAKGKLLKAYLAYAAGKGQDAANGLGFAPLPSEIAGKVKSAVNALS